MLIASGVVALVVGGLAGFIAGQPELSNRSIATRLTSLEEQVEDLSGPDK